MKKIIGGSLFALISSLLFLCNVNAESVYYTNLRGVEMTQAEYEKMKEYFSERKINSLTQKDFDLYNDAIAISSEVVYQRTISLDGKVIKEEIISEEEYNNESYENLPVPYTGDYQYYETASKRLAGQVFNSSDGTTTLVGTLSWKKIPNIKSYDVFAFRVQNFTHSGFYAEQQYYHDGTFDIISYDSTQPGYKYASNGVGVSMNLVDNATGYELTMMSQLNYTSTNALAYISYQHATRNVTRDTSKSYSFSVNGYGNVVLFNTSTIASYYDGMAGIQLKASK